MFAAFAAANWVVELLWCRLRKSSWSETYAYTDFASAERLLVELGHSLLLLDTSPPCALTQHVSRTTYPTEALIPTLYYNFSFSLSESTRQLPYLTLATPTKHLSSTHLSPPSFSVLSITTFLLPNQLSSPPQSPRNNPRPPKPPQRPQARTHRRKRNEIIQHDQQQIPQSKQIVNSAQSRTKIQKMNRGIK